mgnify:CR=1 FL=1
MSSRSATRPHRAVATPYSREQIHRFVKLVFKRQRSHELAAFRLISRQVDAFLSDSGEENIATKRALEIAVEYLNKNRLWGDLDFKAMTNKLICEVDLFVCNTKQTLAALDLLEILYGDHVLPALAKRGPINLLGRVHPTPRKAYKGLPATPEELEFQHRVSLQMVFEDLVAAKPTPRDFWCRLAPMIPHETRLRIYAINILQPDMVKEFEALTGLVCVEGDEGARYMLKFIVFGRTQQ